MLFMYCPASQAAIQASKEQCKAVALSHLEWAKVSPIFHVRMVVTEYVLAPRIVLSWGRNDVVRTLTRESSVSLRTTKAAMRSQLSTLTVRCLYIKSPACHVDMHLVSYVFKYLLSEQTAEDVTLGRHPNYRKTID
jgi:hypothetical protein